MRDHGTDHPLQRELAERWAVRVAGEDVWCYVADRSSSDALITLSHENPALVARAMMVLSTEALTAGLEVSTGRIVPADEREPHARSWLMLKAWAPRYLEDA